MLYDEVNDSLPAEVHSSEEIDDLLTTFERNGIEIYEDQASAKAARAVEVSAEAGDRDAVVKEDAHEPEGDLDLTPGSLEKTNDPVRMYLREMGTVPLLTREGEVTIAKRIERGQLVVMKSITRSPIVIKELISVGEDLKKGARSIKETALGICETLRCAQGDRATGRTALWPTRAKRRVWLDGQGDPERSEG